jgi:hypothetical protein
MKIALAEAHRHNEENEFTNPMKKSDSLFAISTPEFELCSEKKSRGTTSQICSPSLTLATNICTSATLMPVAALNEEKNCETALNEEKKSKTVNNITTSTNNHEVELANTDAMNKLSVDLSEISSNLDVKTSLSEDSEDVPMAFYFTTHGKFQVGADGGCLHCLDLVNKGKSSQKHSNGCPANITPQKKLNQQLQQKLLLMERETTNPGYLMKSW